MKRLLDSQVSRSNGLKHPRGVFAIEGALVAKGVGNRTWNRLKLLRRWENRQQVLNGNSEIGWGKYDQVKLGGGREMCVVITRDFQQAPYLTLSARVVLVVGQLR